jgi:hypothetical protein
MTVKPLGFGEGASLMICKSGVQRFGESAAGGWINWRLRRA